MRIDRRGFVTFAWAALALTTAVIVWGAYVRASGSGAGCGAHWPTCDGEILPRPKTMEMIVELTHRLTSGGLGLIVIGQLVWAFLVFPKQHPARAGAVASMILICTEGAVGAALVLLEHVAGDRSVARAAWVSLHLCNTFLLVAAMACTAYWGATGRPARVRQQGLPLVLLVTGAAGLMLVGVSGAITALGDTLFDAPTLARGIADDFAPGAHFLQQLRVAHPVIAVLTAVFVLYARGPIAEGRGPDAQRWSRALAALVIGQLLLGVVNFVLRAPVSLQLVHLLVADLVWIAFVLLGASALASDPVPNSANLSDASGLALRRPEVGHR